MQKPTSASWKPGQLDRPVGQTFKPGTSGNPGGKPKNIIARARETIGKETRDGVELVEILLSIARNEKEKAADRKACVAELLDRFIGKAPQQIDVDVSSATPAQIATVHALILTPHQRQGRIAQLRAEHQDAIAAPAEAVADVDD